MTNIADGAPLSISPQDLPPVLGQDDLRAAWAALLGPLGFEERVLWVLMMNEHGTCLPALPQVDSLPDVPDSRGVDSVIHAFSRAIVPDGSLAFLITAPGRGPGPDVERNWARELARGMGRAGLRCHPVFAADDHELRMVEPPPAPGCQPAERAVLQ